MATVILVHGFWADGSSWSGVIPRIVAAGHQVLAVQLPLSSFADDVATVARAAARVQGPIVLAGHSYGGVVITEAGTTVPGVGALAYISAYGFDLGEDVNALNAQFPPAGGGTAIRPTEDGHLWLDVDGFADAFCQDLAAETAAVLARVQGPASFACLSGLTVTPAWRTLPSWFLVSMADRTISPDAQRMMASRMGATTVEVDASHVSLISKPAETAELILAAAASLPA